MLPNKILLLILLILAFSRRVRPDNKVSRETYYLKSATEILVQAESAYQEDELCKTRVLAGFEQSDFVLIPESKNIRLQVLMTMPKGFADNFTREYSESDVLFPTVWSTFRFSLNCMVVLIMGENLETVSTFLFVKRIVRPHKDYLIYIGGENQIQSYTSTDFYKRILRFKSTIGFPLVNTGAPSVHNSCDLGSLASRLKIQGRNCPRLLNGNHIKVSAVFGPQMCRFKNHPNGTLISGEGIYFKMLEDGAKRLNYTFSIETATNGGSALVRDNGSWFGAFGDVFTGRADLAVTVTTSAARNLISDPSAPMNWLTRTFFIRSPTLKPRWQAIFWPLSPTVWLATGITMLFFCPIYYYFAIISKKKNSSGDPTRFGKIIFNLISVILDQSAKFRNIMGLRLRLLLMIWAYFSLIIGTSYRSKLVSFLTFLDPEKVPKTHRELAFSDYKIYFRSYNGYALRYTMESKDPIHIKIRNRMEIQNTSTGCIIAATLNEKSACLDYGFSGVYAIHTNATLISGGPPSFLMSSDVDIPIPMIWAFRKSSPLVESMDKVILRSMCSGMHDRWIQDDFEKSEVIGVKWLSTQEKSKVKERLEVILSEQSSGHKPLTVKSLFGIFIIMIVGLGFGVLAFVIEELTQLFVRGKKFH